MPPARRLTPALSLATLLALVAALVPTTASAQGFFDFLWGGGSREVISFSPSFAPGQVIVSFGDKKLYWIHRRGEAISYPIAVPREKSRWSGVATISDKRVNPAWTPTPEMRRENPKLPISMPGGHPLNPLGVRALYLGGTMYRIHGTDAPWTIGTAVSKGCIRMYNEDVLDLYPRVPVGTRVTVTWQRFS
jgi:lipoprotein-anchoring transpeptidase ErfK/SrfK